MRQIKFRGKRVDNGEWVYGDLWRSYGKTETTYVIRDGHGNMSDYEVNPATVGQFTGLMDKNGKEIWEGDVIKFQKFANYNDEITNLSRHTAKVVFIDGSFSWHILRYGANGCFHNSRKIEPLNNTCATWGFEVIGNLHDSPSLTNQ
jgi:uncharacterized phage protein (TIGR01671 family)